MKEEEYYVIPELESIYLEDSYVTDIQEGERCCIFFVDFVLREEHKLYSPPKQDEQYCYKRGCIRFDDLDNLIWINKIMYPLIDANGEVDYGSIDTFRFSGNCYHLSGEWGEIEIIADSLSIEMLEQI